MNELSSNNNYVQEFKNILLSFLNFDTHMETIIYCRIKFSKNTHWNSSCLKFARERFTWILKLRYSNKQKIILNKNFGRRAKIMAPNLYFLQQWLSRIKREHIRRHIKRGHTRKMELKNVEQNNVLVVHEKGRQANN